MVKKSVILGFILVAVVAAGMVWAGTQVAAPQPTVMPAAAPPCVGPGCAPGPGKVKVAPKRLITDIKVNMSYPQPQPPYMGPPPDCYGPPPIPVAVPMWKFIVPWPPFVYYLPVE